MAQEPKPIDNLAGQRPAAFENEQEKMADPRGKLSAQARTQFEADNARAAELVKAYRRTLSRPRH